ncbi:MAG: protein kinase domain-containing protein [Actinoallomurus sp.]
MSLAVGRSPGEGRIVGGHYSLTEKLGEGGLGVVWLALDRETDRTVAVKELLGASVPDSEQVTVHQRINREVATTKTLARHPNIVTLLDDFWEDGRPWIVMEYVPGQSLQRLIQDEYSISPWRAARIGLDVLNALDAAHQAGILHRDVKPSNILLTEGGRALLTDFGIAQFQNDPALTATGQIVGSPGYIAPERLNGKPATHVSDLWALGATLYAAVEGRMPYQRESAWAAMSAALSETVPPPSYAGPLEPVLMGLLERDPNLRMDADTARESLADVVASSSGDGPAIEGLELGEMLDDSTWRARDRRGDEVVVKLVPDGSVLSNAARTLMRWPLDGVVAVRDVGEISNGFSYIVMEYADAGNSPCGCSASRTQRPA